MAKKVYELAAQIGIGAIDLVEKLKGLGFDVRNHMVTLEDNVVEKALEAFGPKPQVATTKKKVTKKKVAKKKVTKKKVVKKVASQSAEGEEKPSEEDSKKVVVKKKTITRKKVVKKKIDEVKPELFEDDKPKGLQVVQNVKAKQAVDSDSSASTLEEDVKEEVYKEKMHSFTPVFVPEKKEQKSSQETTNNSGYKSSGPIYDDKSSSKTDADSKKRMGSLAAIVSKKGGSGKKDLSQVRADEGLKLATNVIGRQVYTPVKRKKIYVGSTKQTEITQVKDAKRFVEVFGVITATELANKLKVKFKEFQNEALKLDLLVKPSDYIGIKLATKLAELYDYRVENRAFDESKFIDQEVKEDKSHLPLRNSIITVMGHVDHGKTTLLDQIRKAKVTDGEAGGITQHIGSYSVKVSDSTITFLDTPGHAAFGAMRQRGADLTDIVILVVAADDGVMPQTKESIKYAKNSNAPIIVAINKMDKEGANPERIKQELTEFELISEEWGGDTMFVPISALNGDGIDDLLESIKLQAEMMDLREDPKGKAEGIIIESRIETGRGPVATVLVKKGTLKKGDAIVCGENYGRARSLMDDSGKNVNSAGPSIPVQILGFNSVPSPGDTLNVVKNEREAKKVVDNRVSDRKKLESVEAPKVASLEDFFGAATDEQEKKILKLVVRSDVQGSYEAIKDALALIGNDEVGVDVIVGGVGAITDNDVTMAASTGGYIIGFNMRPVTSARRLAEQKGVEIRTYSIIYELINDVTLALEGMLDTEKVEKYIGRAEVRETFKVPKVGTIAGCAVIDGKIERGCNIRVLRDGKILHDGKLQTLKRFKDEVKEVGNGYECGMALENFNDVQNSDIIEAYLLEEKKRKLENSEIL
ncbi:MAG: translation initiation factor IF-2 [Bacteriovoracaceae bacterium]|jgi:translation initiation factor IF-2|nr:translation initiation factor IF-2 [Bacteriovoracaceae bacterium]